MGDLIERRVDYYARKISSVDDLWGRMTPEPNSGCWLWTGNVNANGYGTLGRQKAHRAVYEMVVGLIPNGLQIDHLCRTRSCVNPTHLEAVTQGENIRRGISPIANNSRRTHCPKGHALEDGNLIIDQLKRGKRSCLECRRERDRAYQKRQYQKNKDSYNG